MSSKFSSSPPSTTANTVAHTPTNTKAEASSSPLASSPSSNPSSAKHTRLKRTLSQVFRYPPPTNNNIPSHGTSSASFPFPHKRQTALGALSGLLIGLALLVITFPATRATMTLSAAEPLSTGISLPISQHNMALFKALTNGVSGHLSQFDAFTTRFTSQAVAAKLLEDPKIRDGLQKDKRFRLFPQPRLPSAAKLSYIIQSRVSLHRRGTGGMKYMTYWHRDPQFAVYFLDRLYQITDHAIRTDAQTYAAERSAYLQEKLKKVSHVSHRAVLNQLLLEQERTLMLSAIDHPFAAQKVLPAEAHYRSEWPPKTVLLFLCMTLGALGGFVLARALTALRETHETS